MGTRMARSAVLKEPGVNPFVTILVPVLFHGSLDFYAFFAEAEKTSMPVLGYLTTPVNVVLIGWLLFLCRRYGHGSIGYYFVTFRSALSSNALSIVYWLSHLDRLQDRNYLEVLARESAIDELEDIDATLALPLDNDGSESV
jgi:hypothetical protein